MNGIEKITSRIDSDALAQANEVKAKAEKEADEIKASYDKKAQDRYLALVREGVKGTELRAQRLKSTAEMEAKKSILTLKQEMVSKAFDRAKELLRDLDDDKYVALMAKLTARASTSGNEVIILNPRDKAAVGTKIAKAANELLKAEGKTSKLTVGDATRDILGGVILKQGDIEANCSIETLIDTHRSELATQLAETMFA